PHSPWSDPNTITPGRTECGPVSRESACGRKRRRACIPRFTAREYSSSEASASSYWWMLTIASPFMVRTIERRSSAVSSRPLIASAVCIGLDIEGGFEPLGRQGENPLPVLLGQTIPPVDAGPDLRQAAAH